MCMQTAPHSLNMLVKAVLSDKKPEEIPSVRLIIISHSLSSLIPFPFPPRSVSRYLSSVGYKDVAVYISPGCGVHAKEGC